MACKKHLRLGDPYDMDVCPWCEIERLEADNKTIGDHANNLVERSVERDDGINRLCAELAGAGRVIQDLQSFASKKDKRIEKLVGALEEIADGKGEGCESWTVIKQGCACNPCIARRALEEAGGE